ncbi:right-handed parallel beta-helix repeat-containing protein [Haloferula sp.]|uniref:right-handed parallel beta-helix repeat-containing protein n=1 Tax=Haloferula sp. TaxID=2497595 RepID=UPI00329E3F8E
MTTEMRGSEASGMKWVAGLLSALMMLQGAAAAKTVLYVSPDGNDEWSGRSADPEGNDGPLATLEAARLKVRGIKAKSKDAIEVQIRGGDYKLLKTVVFGPADSGSKEAPVTYKAFTGEKPVFSGGVEISKWAQCTKDPAGMAPEAKGKLWVAEIPKASGAPWVIRSLFDGEDLLNRARSGSFKYRDVEKENDSNRQGKKLTSVLDYEGKPLPAFDRTIHYRDQDLRAWPNPSDIELILKDRPWLANVIALDRVDTKTKIAHLAVDPTYQAINPNNRYWVENAIDHLDEPGEWVVNTQEGRIYMWPEKEITEMKVIAPYLSEFIRVEGEEDGPFAAHLRFEGLTFTHGVRDTLHEDDKGLQHDWEMYDKANAVVRFRNAEDCSLSSSVIKASSGTGVRLDQHCQRIKVASNHLHHLGGGGIVVSGYGPGTKDVNKNNVVHDNYIHHIGELLWHSAAIFIAQSGHNEISHNTICEVPYNGIVVSGCRPHEFYLVKRIPFRRAWVSSIRFEECEPFIKKGLAAKSQNHLEHFLPLLHARENKIIMNDISRTLLKLHDGNAIYFSAMGEDNLVERNYLHQNHDTAGAVRLDDNPSFTIIRENVITESERGLGLKGPADVINNFIFTETFLRGRSTPGWLGGTKQALPVRNVFMPPASSKSSNGLYLTDDRAIDKPFYENLPRMKDSIYFTANTGKPYVPKTALGNDLFTGKPVIPGKDSVKLQYVDPMFDEAAMKEGLYRFKKGSPAEKLGIKPVDLREVGSSLAGASDSGTGKTVFDFTDGSTLDAEAGIVGATMTVDGIALTTRAIIGSDQSEEGNTTTIYRTSNALSINTGSVSGSEYQNFDPQEAWVFDFDTDVMLEVIDFSGLGRSETMKVTIFDGSNGGAGVVRTVTDKDLLSLKKPVSAGTDIRIEQIAGKARIDSISVSKPSP